jgi:hypothetical protein
VPFPKKQLKGGYWQSVICPKCFSLESIELLDYSGNAVTEFRESLVRQEKNDYKRKLVGSGVVDILFWFDDKNEIYGFQFTMREGEFFEHAFTWSRDRGIKFRRVFTERREFLTNTLQAAEEFPKEKFKQSFLEYGKNLKAEYRDFVMDKIDTYSG